MARALLPVLLLVLITEGTAGAQPAVESFERRVAPVPVYDSTGTRLRFPFLGGLNRPRPQLVDVDADGDRDLFVQERAGRVMFFENEGTDGAPIGAEPLENRFVFRSAAYRDLDVGQWYRFADMDGDGDFDLLAEQPLSHVRYYRNTGTPGAPAFELATDTLRTTDGTPIFADRRNRPAAFRAGCEELPSLMFGGLDGRLRFFRSVGIGPDGVPRLRLVSESFQGVCVGPASVCGFGNASGSEVGAWRPRPSAARPTLRHGANALAAGDLDGDGDDDLLWGDFFSNSFYRIENGGTCETLALRRAADVFPPADPVETGGFNAADLADLEGDGDADLVFGVLGGSGAGGAGAVENLYFLEHTAGGFTERTRRLLSMVDVGGESVPAFGDLDGDGDLDLLVGAEQAAGAARGPLVYFENTAEETAGRPVLRQQPARHTPFAALPQGFSAHPALGDLDGDGDLDLVLGTFGGLALYENTGRPGRPEFDAGTTFPLEVPSGNYFAPAPADVDADGDLDLVVGTSGGTLSLFRNTGTAEVPRFVLETERFGGIDVGGRAVPAFRDADRDSDLDLYVGAREGLHFYENTGAASRPFFAGEGAPMRLALPMLVTPTFADLNADGQADLVAGGEGGGLFFFEGEHVEGEEPPGRDQPVQAVPNPFQERTTLRFRLAEAAAVRLTLYDARGRRVEVLFEGHVAAGQRVALPLRAGSMASGVYFFRLTAAGEALDTGSIVLVR